MSVQQFFDAARSVLEQHNEAIGEGNPGFVQIDQFIDCIKAIGGSSPAALADFSNENIANCLPNYPGPYGTVKPWPLAKAINKAFKKVAKEQRLESGEPEKSKFTGKKSAKRMSLEELVHALDPEEPTSAVGKRLLEISRGEPFIIYSSGRMIDHDATIKLLQEVKIGHEGRSVYEGKRVYPVGDLPENYADENPLYRGRPLRPDGTCDQLDRSWEGVPHEVRQFIAFATEYQNGIDIIGKGGRDRAHAAMDMALASNALSILKRRYPEIAVEFEEAKKLGKLPILQIPLGQPIAAQEVGAGPFRVGGR